MTPDMPRQRKAPAAPPAKPPARKASAKPPKDTAAAPDPRTIMVPAGLTVEIIVSRGDVTLRSDAKMPDVLDVARALVLLVREIATRAPDILPHAETVPGGVLTGADDWDAWGRARTAVGFRPR